MILLILTHPILILNSSSVHCIRFPCWQTVEKLVVFLLGLVSHQVADINWHSLGISQGFLQTMGKVGHMELLLQYWY